jgi:undecaprenyl-diphosphatase
MHPTLTYPEAIVVGLFQGVTELFPVSSLGHSVLIPALVGGSWSSDLDVTAPQSPYLAFIVGMHVATAIAMIIYFWRDWLRIVTALAGSVSHIASPAPGTRRLAPQTVDQKLGWMIILGTIPVGLAGLALDHPVRTVFAKPVPTAIFLAINGLILLFGEYMRRRRSGLDERQALDNQQMSAVGGAAAHGAGYEAAGHGNAGDPYARRDAYDRDPYGGAAYGSAPYGGAGHYVEGGQHGDPDPFREGSQYGAGQYGPGQPADPWPAARQPGGGSPAGPASPRPNGYSGGRHARPASGQRAVKQHEAELAVLADQRITRLSWMSALGLGASQILALFPGISRDGSVMVSGLVRGLSRQDAARFSFLLSAPVIFAAGVFKAGELLGPETAGIRGPILVGSVISGIGAYLALRFLDRYLSNPKRTLTPFAIYCLVMGIISLIILGG